MANQDQPLIFSLFFYCNNFGLAICKKSLNDHSSKNPNGNLWKPKQVQGLDF